MVVQKAKTHVTDTQEWEKAAREAAEKVLALGRRMRPGTEDAAVEHATDSVDRAMRRAVRLALSQESLGRTISMRGQHSATKRTTRA